MKFIHTADWHLGKLVQGIYMTEDQKHVLQQLIDTVASERPDAVVIAGDLYDRAVPPTEAVELLDQLLEQIVVDLQTPVIAISGNHDSPDRLNFATTMMKGQGLHLSGQLRNQPVILHDEFGEVHFHLVPYADPAQIRYLLKDETIRSHDDAARAIVTRLTAQLDPAARHVYVGHAFVTPYGEKEENTSDSERPLSIGGAEYVQAGYFAPFHYTALGHLHQAHYVGAEKIRYAGSPLKYSISEEHHNKGYLMVELDGQGQASIEKRSFTPKRDLRRIEASIEEIERHPLNEDYVFVTLLNEDPVLYPMEKVRAVYPNAMHVERRWSRSMNPQEAADEKVSQVQRKQADPGELFAAFYGQVRGNPLSEEKKRLFQQVYAGAVAEEEEAG
ncbi:exonuclease SbcCD subunit D [Paenibacillus agricola]|uniref:Nuclease SbcCD subunit D n=1 Tax=Paenibacillus agricola TaxID=2716264 RepID=A0ABX0J5U8_9BACL|nr:exonuclease SbcCD subunit D [Paenibacillus agricola]NHN29190.1 exonuclease SbcCD subunit D [Paenibacillus agricola]